MLKLSFTLIITLAIITGTGLFFYSRELMTLLYDTHIEASDAVFRLLIPGFIAVSATYIFGTLLTANGNLKQMNLIALTGLVINFLLNFFLIPRFMATGSAIASLVTQFAMAILQVAVVQRIFRFRVNYRYMLTLAAFFFGVVALSMLSKRVCLPSGLLPVDHEWIARFMLMLVSSLLLAGILRLWSFRSLAKILREDR